MRALTHASIQIINNLTICIANLVKHKKSFFIDFEKIFIC